jgi:hypothetical protein
VKRLLLSLALLLSIGGSANAYVCPNGPPSPWPGPTYSCLWEPQADSTHPSVQACQAGGPAWGFVYFYSGLNYTGDCAAVAATENLGWGYGIHGPYNFVMLNGFWEGVPVKKIQSMKLGGSAPSSGGMYTAISLSNGPDAAVSPDPYISCAISNWATTPKVFPDILATCTGGPAIFSFYMFAQ